MGLLRPTRHLRTFSTRNIDSRHFSCHRGSFAAQRKAKTEYLTGRCPNGQRRALSESVEGRGRDHYKELGLLRESTAAQIKFAYYRLAKKHHPDTAGPDADRGKLQRIQEAYDVLGDRDARLEYDRSLGAIPKARVNSGARPKPSGYYGGHSTRTGPSLRAQRRKEAMQQGTWSSRNSPDRGFAPRASWDPQFRDFFDSWVTKMGELGMSKEELESEKSGPGPSPRVLEQLMDADMLRAYMKKRRAEGKDPLDGVFKDEAGRNSRAGHWLKNRMAMLDREGDVQAGGTWERGGSKRAGTTTSGRGFAASWGRDAPGSKRLDEDGPAGRLGGYGTGEETFNSPWDEIPRRGFQRDVPRPWWAVGGAQGASHTYDAWSPNPSLSGAWGRRPPGHPSMLYTSYSSSSTTLNGGPVPQPIKRDYTKGHQLDPRFEDDRAQIVSKEKRMITGAVVIGVAIAVISGTKGCGSLEPEGGFTMKGLIIEEFKKPYSFRNDLPIPDLEPGLMLVKVIVAGFCHTELLVLD
ncbi:hypothetical protein FRC17_006696, partial [Serendipita sp. 399]